MNHFLHPKGIDWAIIGIAVYFVFILFTMSVFAISSRAERDAEKLYREEVKRQEQRVRRRKRQ